MKLGERTCLGQLVCWVGGGGEVGGFWGMEAGGS